MEPGSGAEVRRRRLSKLQFIICQLFDRSSAATSELGAETTSISGSGVGRPERIAASMAANSIIENLIKPNCVMLIGTFFVDELVHEKGQKHRANS